MLKASPDNSYVKYDLLLKIMPMMIVQDIIYPNYQYLFRRH
jgi:hypothetical protein